MKLTDYSDFLTRRLSAYLYVLICCLVFSLRPLDAAIINVPGDYATIQAAVNAAASTGDTIQIAAGTYVEQVEIVNKSLDIVGAGQGLTIIKSPPASVPLTQYFTYTPMIRVNFFFLNWNIS